MYARVTTTRARPTKLSEGFHLFRQAVEQTYLDVPGFCRVLRHGSETW